MSRREQKGDIRAILHADEIHEGELELVLVEHFHSARSISATEIVYPNDTTDYAVKLVYKDGALAKILPGPRLTEDDVTILEATVTKTLLDSSKLSIARHVLFAEVDVLGCFRYDDLFQVLPMPPSAPRSGGFAPEHPFLLEHRYPSSSNIWVDGARRNLRGMELELLMAGLLHPSVHSHGLAARFHWVHLQGDPPRRSAFLQQLYTWPGQKLIDEAFTPIADEPTVRSVDPATFYSQHPRKGAPELIQIPSNLTHILQTFFAANRTVRERFLRACFWFQHSAMVRSHSASAAFTALISAVEALAPSLSLPRCPECGKSTGPGPTQRFVDFVERFSSASGVDQSDRKRFYAIRSALSHGGTLLHSDRTRRSPSFVPGHIREWDDMESMWIVVRMILANWILSHS